MVQTHRCSWTVHQRLAAAAAATARRTRALSNHAGHQDNAQEQLGIDLQLRHSNLLVKSSRLPSICVTDDDEDEDLCTASCLFVCLPVCARRALAHKSARKYTHKCCTSVRAFCACCTQQRRLAHGNSDAVVLGCGCVCECRQSLSSSWWCCCCSHTTRSVLCCSTFHCMPRWGLSCMLACMHAF